MKRCILCTQAEAVHPEVGFGYVPHAFQPAEWIHTDTGYEGPDRRKLIRRMDDRVAVIEAVMHSVEQQP